MKPRRGEIVVKTPGKYRKALCKLVRAGTPLHRLIKWAEERGLYLQLELMEPEKEILK